MQKHLRNPEKRYRKLKKAKKRERNSMEDAMHMAWEKLVSNNLHIYFVFKDLKIIKKAIIEERNSGIHEQRSI
ncbi:hypothetical protein OXIME_000345 [Oxyplasma meridianum]|uniref:Uncharacterized protein n=1 Tax=Oxyplasma meridianum TaxID=3073602 RepID=A0AAX4NE76_9ARCH